MLPPNFTKRASKMIVSCEASSKFHRTMLPKRAFRAMLPTIFTKNLRFATVSRNHHAASCERVHPPKAKCASHYNAVHSQLWQCAFRHSAVHKNVWIYPPWTDPLRAHKNVRFYYSFRRSTPRFYLLRPLKRRQNDVLPVLLRTTPVLQKLPKRAFRARLPQIFTEKASKMIVSCKASCKFHRTSFQNERFARCFRQFSQKKLPNRIVSRDASSKFHRTSFQNERFARCFLQISQNELPKWSFRARLPPNFTEQCSQNERFARCFRQFSPKICVSLQFRAITTPLPARGFIRQKQNVLRTTTPCIPNCDNVRFATAPCTKMYESIHREPTRFAHTKMWGFTTVLGDRHHVFTERVARRQSKFAFRYSFGRSTPRFYREGSPRANEICVSLQFWAINTTFLPRGFTASKWNLRFATVLGDRHHVCSERVHREQMKFAFRYSFGRSTPRL